MYLLTKLHGGDKMPLAIFDEKALQCRVRRALVRDTGASHQVPPFWLTTHTFTSTYLMVKNAPISRLNVWMNDALEKNTI